MKKIIFILLYFIFSRPVLAVDVGRYDVFEDTITHAQPANPWEDASGSYVTADFISPTKTISIEGFYYDTNTYKVRFTPTELGTYTYKIYWRTGTTKTEVKSGTFNSVASTNHGFIRRHPTNNYRFQFEDGTFFNGVGHQAGGFFSDTKNPDGTYNSQMMSVDSWNDVVDIDTWFKLYADSGFSLFRINPDNGIPSVFGNYDDRGTTGNSYLKIEGKLVDFLLLTAHKYKYHVQFAIWRSPPFTNTADAGQMASLKRTISYAIARWGAYTDIWELANETQWMKPNDPGWISINWFQNLRDHILTKDSYQRLVTNSHPFLQDWTVLDIRSPHPNLGVLDTYKTLKFWTDYTDTLTSPSYVPTPFRTNRPVIIGEAYNSLGGGNGYGLPGSSVAIRTTWGVRETAWITLMSGIGTIWWNVTGDCSTCGGLPNQHLGPKERAAVKIARDFLVNMDKNSQFQVLTSTNCADDGQCQYPSIINGISVYSLSSPTTIWVYFFKYPWLTPTTNTTTTSVNIPFNGTASWIDPATGNVLSSSAVTAGTKSFTTPNFSQDLALRITSSSTPVAGDLNGDGKVDILDFRLAIKDLASILNLNSLIANFGK